MDEGPIKKNKVIHYGNSSDSIQNPSKADSVVPKRKDMAGETETQNVSVIMTWITTLVNDLTNLYIKSSLIYQ